MNVASIVVWLGSSLSAHVTGRCFGSQRAASCRWPKAGTRGRSSTRARAGSPRNWCRRRSTDRTGPAAAEGVWHLRRPTLVLTDEQRQVADAIGRCSRARATRPRCAGWLSTATASTAPWRQLAEQGRWACTCRRRMADSASASPSWCWWPRPWGGTWPACRGWRRWRWPAPPC